MCVQMKNPWLEILSMHAQKKRLRLFGTLIDLLKSQQKLFSNKRKYFSWIFMNDARKKNNFCLDIKFFVEIWENQPFLLCVGWWKIYEMEDYSFKQLESKVIFEIVYFIRWRWPLCAESWLCRTKFNSIAIFPNFISLFALELSQYQPFFH